MANAWGTSWGPASGVGNAWGVSWGGDAVTQTDTGLGSWQNLLRAKRRGKKPIQVIRWSDFETREKRAEALAMALAQTAVPIKQVEDDEEEDEIILQALTRLFQ